MEKEHRIIEEIKIIKFIQKVKAYGLDNIETTEHCFFRLSQKQRKIHTEEELKRIVWNEKPLLVGIETNGNYNAIYFYLRDKKIRIILRLSLKKLYIVTFYILNVKQEEQLKNG
ncbi:MAG TPA: hypothetical protein VJ438_01445 [Candidatus Nanoarchaeia archaeon]|nr:hypothetical protein [Candidatus Nanoarchaeia archaeon]